MQQARYCFGCRQSRTDTIYYVYAERVLAFLTCACRFVSLSVCLPACLSVCLIRCWDTSGSTLKTSKEFHRIRRESVPLPRTYRAGAPPSISAGGAPPPCPSRLALLSLYNYISILAYYHKCNSFIVMSECAMTLHAPPILPRLLMSPMSMV